MKSTAALAIEAGKPLEITEVLLDGPKEGEVLVEIMATGICHTDAYTLDGLASAYRDYRRLTDHWRQELGSDFVEITLETLIDNQDSEIRRLMTETGIGFDERCLSPHKADGGVSTASSVQVRRPINRSGVGTWRRYADELAPLLRALQADGFVDADGEAIWPAR